jgi:RNA polymerase sigma-70 factor, ECF subfamily
MLTADVAAPPSETLARDAQRGSHKALDLLIRRHKSEAYRVALRMCGRPFDAEEILQVSLERLVRHLGHYDPARPFRPWLLKIVSNQARSFLRLQKLKAMFFLENQVDPQDPSPVVASDRQISQGEVRLHIEQGLLALPVDQREAFILKHIEGLSFEELSEITGVSAGALRVRTHRARKALLEYLRDRNVTVSSLGE